MEYGLTTPALLFPAISLLLLAYTNRFLTLAALMRDLYGKYRANPEERIKAQLHNLRYRIIIIRNMQVFGVSSFFGCVLSMILIFSGWLEASKWVFGLSLGLLLVSLALSLREVQVSVDALSLQLADLDAPPEHPEGNSPPPAL